MKSLYIQAFGKLRIQVETTVINSFATRHVEELFGYLLLNQHVALPREKLMGILWPECGSQKARRRFSTTLWRLRCLFDTIGMPADLCLQAGRESVTFATPEQARLDVALFEHYLHEAEQTAEAAERERLLAAAAALNTAELYVGIYSDWCIVERERLARLRLRALGQLMACAMQRDAYTEAADLGQRILDEDPLREEVHRALMHCYVAMGRNARAIQQFQTCANLLMDELRVLPMPETVALYQQTIEQRLEEVQPQLTHHADVWAAFADFQRAAERLNALLAESKITHPQADAV